MTDAIVVDANLLVLLAVGSASREHIAKHESLTAYSADDFDLLVELIGRFSELILLPHVLAEVSSLAQQIKNPARARIREKLRELVETNFELPLASAWGVRRGEFLNLGLTDAVILHLLGLSGSGMETTLATADSHLANAAHSLGYGVIDYEREYRSGRRS